MSEGSPRRELIRAAMRAPYRAREEEHALAVTQVGSVEDALARAAIGRK